MSEALRAGYKLTEVGVIPEDWEAEPIGRCLKIRHGKSQHEVVSANGEYPIFGTGGEMGRASRPLYSKPSVLIGRKGTIDAPRYLDTPFWTVDTLFYSEVFENVDAKFMFYQFCLVDWYSYNEASGVPSLNAKTIEKIQIPLPPFKLEQCAIAAALSDIDTLLAKLDTLIAKKRNIKQATMQQLLTGQTRLPGFSGGWEVKRLGDVAIMGSGGTPTSSVASYYDGDIPWVSIADMTKGGKVIKKTERCLSVEGLTNSPAQIFSVGTVLYAMYASLGECSIAGMPLCTSQAILGIRPQEKLSSEYLYYFLTSLKSIVKSMGQQGTQSNLNKGMVQAFELNLPTIPEQTAIASVLSDMDTELASLETRRDKTLALKQGMMQELLTGRIRLV